MNTDDDAKVLAHELTRPEEQAVKASRMILLLIDQKAALRSSQDALLVRVAALEEENRRRKEQFNRLVKASNNTIQELRDQIGKK